MADELVNHPKHYNNHPKGFECIEIVRKMSFNSGGAFKYGWRHKFKNAPLIDLQKALWYLQDEIEQLEKMSRWHKFLYFVSRSFFMPVLPYPQKDILEGFHPALAAGISAILDADFVAKTANERGRYLRVALDCIGMYADYPELFVVDTK